MLWWILGCVREEATLRRHLPGFPPPLPGFPLPLSYQPVLCCLVDRMAQIAPCRQAPRLLWPEPSKELVTHCRRVAPLWVCLLDWIRSSCPLLGEFLS